MLQQVTEGVYAIVGELGNRSADNLANNATFGIVTFIGLLGPGSQHGLAHSEHPASEDN
jgi:hypothetical protein